MSDTNVTGASQTHAPANPQNVDTDESKETGPLASAHPNAKVAAARTPPRADAPQQATREQVAASLAEVVSRNALLNRPGKAAQKANDLLNLLPQAHRTPTALNNLQNVLKSQSKAVTDLLRSAHDNYKTPALRQFFRAEVLKQLAAGSTIEQAREHADYLVARRNVINSMMNVMHGKALVSTALDKAKLIIDSLPDKDKTPTGMRNIQDKLDNNRAAVKELLHSVKPAFADRNHRMSLRVELVSNLASDATIADAQTHRDDVFARERFIGSFLKDVVVRGSYETERDAARAVYDQLPAHLQTSDALQQMLDYYDENDADVENAFTKINDALDHKSKAYILACADTVALMAQNAAIAQTPAQATTQTQDAAPEQAAAQAQGPAQIEVEAPPVRLHSIIPTPVISGDAFLDANQGGTPATPTVLDYRGDDCRNTLTKVVNGQGTYRDIQVSDRGAGFEATGAGYVLTSNIFRTQAVAVFWENENGDQNATLLNDTGLANAESVFLRLHKIDPEMQVHSLNWLQVEPAGAIANGLARINTKTQAALELLAQHYNAPLNIINRPHASAQNPNDDPNVSPPLLSMMVDTQNAKIFIMPEQTYIAHEKFGGDGVPFPAPTRNALEHAKNAEPDLFLPEN